MEYLNKHVIVVRVLRLCENNNNIFQSINLSEGCLSVKKIAGEKSENQRIIQILAGIEIVRGRKGLLPCLSKVKYGRSKDVNVFTNLSGRYFYNFISSLINVDVKSKWLVQESLITGKKPMKNKHMNYRFCRLKINSFLCLDQYLDLLPCLITLNLNCSLKRSSVISKNSVFRFLVIKYSLFLRNL